MQNVAIREKKITPTPPHRCEQSDAKTGHLALDLLELLFVFGI
jgi:hypothetical protein